MLFDLHAHTRFGSRCATQTPAQLLTQAKKVGLGGICFTEHEAAWDPAELRALSEEFGILVLGGMEVKTYHGEVLVIGAKRPLFHISNPKALRSLVHEDGGIMIAAHPFREYMFMDDIDGGREMLSPGTFLTVEAACKLPFLQHVDAIEVFNGMSVPREALFAKKVAERLCLLGTGGSDTHQPHVVGWCTTEFARPVQSEDEFIKEFKAGNFKAIHRILEEEYACQCSPTPAMKD